MLKKTAMSVSTRQKNWLESDVFKFWRNIRSCRRHPGLEPGSRLLILTWIPDQVGDDTGYVYSSKPNNIDSYRTVLSGTKVMSLFCFTLFLFFSLSFATPAPKTHNILLVHLAPWFGGMVSTRSTCIKC